MEELEMHATHIDKLAKAIFGGGGAGQSLAQDGDVEDEGLSLEDNDGGVNVDAPTATVDHEDGNEGIALEDNELEPAVLPPVPVVPEISPATKKVAERVKNQGNDALKAGKIAEAATFYSQAIGLDPTNAAYFSNRSSAHATLGSLEKALDDAQQCIRLKPEWAKGHLRAGSALSALKRHQEAKEAYMAAQRCEPTNRQIAALLNTVNETIELES
jgi:tetratricopeptide (TPR) repeat protein